MCNIALARSVPLFLVMPVNEICVILSALAFYYKLIRFPRFLTAFWAYCYHFRANNIGDFIKYIVYPCIESSEPTRRDTQGFFSRFDAMPKFVKEIILNA